MTTEQKYPANTQTLLSRAEEWLKDFSTDRPEMNLYDCVDIIRDLKSSLEQSQNEWREELEELRSFKEDMINNYTAWRVGYLLKKATETVGPIIESEKKGQFVSADIMNTRLKGE